MKFLHFICKLTRPFFKQFQSAKPNIHNLFTNSLDMFETIAKLVMRRINFQNMEDEEVDWFDNEIMLPDLSLA